MKPMKYLLYLGIKVILEECNYNLKWIKDRLKRVCGKNYNFGYCMKIIKEYLVSNYNQADTEDKKNVIKLIKKEFNLWKKTRIYSKESEKRAI